MNARARYQLWAIGVWFSCVASSPVTATEEAAEEVFVCQRAVEGHQFFYVYHDGIWTLTETVPDSEDETPDCDELWSDDDDGEK